MRKSGVQQVSDLDGLAAGLPITKYVARCKGAWQVESGIAKTRVRCIVSGMQISPPWRTTRPMPVIQSIRRSSTTSSSPLWSLAAGLPFSTSAKLISLRMRLLSGAPRNKRRASELALSLAVFQLVPEGVERFSGAFL